MERNEFTKHAAAAAAAVGAVAPLLLFLQLLFLLFVCDEDDFASNSSSLFFLSLLVVFPLSNLHTDISFSFLSSPPLSAAAAAADSTSFLPPAIPTIPLAAPCSFLSQILFLPLRLSSSHCVFLFLPPSLPRLLYQS